MKRQFLRVKQIADQTFLRAEKSDVLTEDLVNAEKRVELIKQSCQNTGKKIANCLQGGGTDPVSIEKRQKKMPEMLLHQAMQECSLLLGENSVIGSTLDQCANIQETIGKELLWYETEVEKVVLTPIVNLLQNEIPNIVKLRKNLNKLTLDMDSARNRYQTAIRHNSQQAIGSSSANVTAKIDALREELEEASMKVEQCRDALATEMYVLISREPELAEVYLQLYKIQADYHKKVLRALEERLPALTGHIKDFAQRPVFGCKLEEHLRVTDRQIALVLETCIGCLLAYGLEEEGLFRIAGSALKIKKLKSAFDAGILDLSDYTRDPHSIAGVLKSYLRELPEPLLTFSLYDEWMDAVRIQEQDLKLQALWQVVNRLPEPNFQNLRYLVKFLAKLAEYADVNKMSPQNIAIVMAPSLMWPAFDDGSTHLGMNMTVANLHSAVIDALVTYADWFFPGEVEFKVISPTSPKSAGESPPNSANDCMTASVSSHSNSGPTNGEVDIENAMNNNLTCSNTSTWSRSPKSLHRPSKKPAPPVPASVAQQVSSENSSLDKVALRHTSDRPPTSSELSASYTVGLDTGDNKTLTKKNEKHVAAYPKFATLHAERPDKPERRSLVQRRSSENLFAAPAPDKQALGSKAEMPNKPDKEPKQEDLFYSTSSLRRPLKMAEKPEVPPHAFSQMRLQKSGVSSATDKPIVPPHAVSASRHEKHQSTIERPSVPPPERPSKPDKPAKPPKPACLESAEAGVESGSGITKSNKRISLSEIDFELTNAADPKGPTESRSKKEVVDINDPTREHLSSLEFVEDSDHDELNLSALSLSTSMNSSGLQDSTGDLISSLTPQPGSQLGSDTSYLSKWDFLMSRSSERAPDRPPRGCQPPSEHSTYRNEFLSASKSVEGSTTATDAQNGMATITEGLAAPPIDEAPTASSSAEQKYCTIIQVGGTGNNNGSTSTTESKVPASPGTLRNRVPRPQPPPPLPPNKPRVNSSSEDTKL